MARGKLKYKDVVGKQSGHRKNIKHQSKKLQPRKKFGLQKHDNRNTYKRKFKGNVTKEIEVKKQKIEEPVVDSSYSESDSENDMKKLLHTFGSNLNSKNSLAIESSESGTDENDDANIDVHGEESENDLETYGSVSEDIELDEEKKVVPNDSIGREDIGVPEKENSEEMENDIEDDEIDLEIQDEDDDNENLKDPFVKHVGFDLHDSLLESVQNSPMSVNHYSKFWPKLGKIFLQIPKCDKVTSEQNEFSISEKKNYAAPGEVPKQVDVKHIKPQDLYLKSQIWNNLHTSNKNNVSNPEQMFTPLQGEIFAIINNYQDLYYPERTVHNAEEIRYAYCLHAVNHILKTRLKVIHHNARLSKKDEVPEQFRDQGLVRPKVLFIVPFKDAAYKIIQLIIDIILPKDKGSVMNKKRFIEDYTGNELILPKKNPKPEDYEHTFQGNTSDDFKLGITVTKKSLKLYANFYSSDIIIASPLGLRTVIGAEGEQERDYDFLASIELLILDQTEIFLMQNWDHVVHILSHMHLQPKESHNTDFSRVRMWSLNGWAKYYRQTLIFSSFVLPEINAIFNRKCLNYAGKVKVVNPIEFGSITQVFVQIPHVYQRFDAQNATDAIDARFDFFINKVLPQQREGLMKQTLIFIPNYFDYVRVRNYFKKEDIGFVQICEYSKEGKVARARDMFYHGDAHFLLYTERYHFFNRKRIKGIRHLVFYQLPIFPHFYYEMCNLMQEANMNKKIGSISNMTVTVIYSKYDIHQLSGVVSTERAAKMSQSDRKVHLMVTGGD